MNSSVIDYMAEAVHSFGVEVKLLLLEVELRLAQLGEYELEVFLMLLYAVTEHEYIIQIYVYESSDVLSEDCCH
jgi:hypothetical protein